MVTPTGGWVETDPAGGSDISLGDNAIRTAKAQIREVVAVDHEFASNQTADTAGQHKKVTLQEQADLGTGAVDATILGSQTISGKGELVYTDEDDNDIQITKAGALAGSTAAELLAVVGPALYPKGSIYANYFTSANPSTYFGFGTWVAIEEEVIAGYKSGGTFDPVGSLSEGAESVTLSAAESGVAAHTHGSVFVSGSTNGDGAGGPFAVVGTSGGVTGGAAAASSAHNNIQPTYVAYL